jgi:HlyD family secretion protein
VEPIGKTKVSALGIEEQRVDVVIDFTGPPALWQKLGHGFRAETRIVLWEAADVLKVPLSALFRSGDRWAVFVASDGRVRRRFVRIGHRTAIEAEVLEGLRRGERVVVHPSDLITDGVRVAQRL